MNASPPIIQVIVVDDHRLFRKGLQASFCHAHPDIIITGEADTGDSLFTLAALPEADMVLLDVHLPGGIDGSEVARRLRSEYPAVKILAISGENSAETVKSMLEAGIDGFISKQWGDIDELARAIREVHEGLEYFGRDIASMMSKVYASKKQTSEVTPEFAGREREVIELSRDGLQCKEIAARLGISISTVKTYKERIFLKLGLNTTMEVVQYALKKGIIRIEN